MHLLLGVNSSVQILFTIYRAVKIDTAFKSTFDTFMVINVMFVMFLWGNFDQQVWLTVCGTDKGVANLKKNFVHVDSKKIFRRSTNY